ncbi:MAG: type II secretion system protein GspM [Desulfuromonadales bacterium]
MISQLNQRERVFAIAGGISLILALLYFAILMPYRSTMTKLDSRIEVRSQQLQEVKSLRAQYLALQQQISQVEKLVKNSQDFSALTFIENLVQQTAGRENLLSMRPQAPQTQGEFIADSVEIKLEKLTLKQVLELLWGVEKASTPMQVDNLFLKQRFDDRSLLDATMTIRALRRSA